MDFSEAVQWWEEWQLRVLVLTSLFLQYFLFIASSLRKRSTPAWFKFLTWITYLASDAVAIYALATLFNRHKKEWVSSAHHSNASLEVLWAPILLLHLGGQDGITAYNIEDNELWRRHVLTAVSQITVAIYVFRKSWSGDKRLLQAAILVFVPGILKCLEKPIALKSASINSIVNTSSTSWLDMILEDDKDDSKDIKLLGEFVADASSYMENQPEPRNKDDDGASVKNDKPYNLFVDLADSYPNRLKKLKYMVPKKEEAHDWLRSRLSKAFDRFYTKNEMSKGLNFTDMSCKSFCGGQLRGVVVYFTFAAIGLFHKSHRENYDTTDVKITYTLLCCTAALEYIVTGIKPYFDFYERLTGRRWPDLLAQYNLIGFMGRNKKLHKRLWSFLLIGEDVTTFKKPCNFSSGITKLVHAHVTTGWKECIKDVKSFHEFNDSRGQYTLKQELKLDKEARQPAAAAEEAPEPRCPPMQPTDLFPSLYGSLQRPFDESVLQWHLATDFCFHKMGTGKSSSHDDDATDAAARCRKMSNYMAHLLFVDPEMLVAGARRSVFTDAYERLKKMVPTPDGGTDSGELASKIIENMGSKQEDLVHDAWALAQELMDIGNKGVQGEKKMWNVIQGVWVQMLCFSASRCRGYLHAKSLGKGGEYLSYVWMLLLYMGMETLSERMQRTEMDVKGDTGVTRPASATPAPPAGDENA